MFGIIVAGKRVYDKFAEDEMTVYAAQVSFFIILSVVPFIMLLLTAVQMIPSISNARFMELIVGLVPVDYKSLAFRVVNDLSLKSPATMISVTAVTALWSAGRGMFSVARGLNRVNGHGEKRWYVINRLICSGYTIVFILVCILSLGLLVFGNMIQAFMVSRFPIIADVTTHIINFRALWALMILIIFFLGIYTFVPDKKLKLREQIPGAVHRWMDGLLLCLFPVFQPYRGEELLLYVRKPYRHCAVASVALFLHVHPVLRRGNQLFLEGTVSRGNEGITGLCLLLDKGRAVFVFLVEQ